MSLTSRFHADTAWKGMRRLHDSIDRGKNGRSSDNDERGHGVSKGKANDAGPKRGKTDAEETAPSADAPYPHVHMQLSIWHNSIRFCSIEQ